VGARAGAGGVMGALAVAAPGVEDAERFEGFSALTLRAGELSASFVPSLGMVGASLRHAGEELLDRRDGLSAYRDTGATGSPWAPRSPSRAAGAA
jgi:hypothetical protein